MTLIVEKEQVTDNKNADDRCRIIRSQVKIDMISS